MGNEGLFFLTILVVSGVGDNLLATVGKVDGVGASDVAVSVLLFGLLEVGAGVFVSNSVPVLVGLGLLLLVLGRGGVIRSRGGVIRSRGVVRGVSGEGGSHAQQGSESNENLKSEFKMKKINNN